MSMHKELCVKSRVRGDFHARFCERVRVKLPRSTRPTTPYTVTLKIWTKVKEIEHTAVTYLSDSDKRLHAFSNGELTEHEFVNACFSAAEQVSEIQANLLSAAIELATGGTAQPHVGTGGGGSTSELPWRNKDKDKYKTTKKR